MAKQKFLNRISDAAEKVILSRVKNSSIFSEYYNRSDKKAQWNRQSKNYERKDIEDWKMAVMSATDPENPRRGLLMRFYESLMLDLHLASVIDTRILRVQRSSFKIVDANGKENEELKELLERPWYDELVRLTCLKTFQGTTLIEMFDLDENGELIRVNEIPQSNFIPQKGVVIKEEYDDNGVSYRDGRYKDFYIQIGSDWELGMLNQLAMIVLAKKLGIGSWMNFIEKFGVPPLFAITDRMDTGRRDELFEMLENFRMNHFAVLNGNEKIEMPNNYNVDGYQSFKSLISDVCNTEISKRVLGGTATTDEKSFVGSAEVQERVAQDRHEADKLLFKYYFNSHIRQRLSKLSSVYSGFANHTLVWDNQETLDIEKYIDGVQKLSSHYEFDIEEVRSRTGLPITGMKQTIQTPGTETTSEKKKTEANLGGIAPFASSSIMPSVFAATWDNAIDRLATEIFNGETKPSDLDRDLVLKNYSAINKEAATAWGSDYYEKDITRKMRQNLLQFSGAKSHNLMTKLQQLTKQKLERNEYVDQAKKVVDLHNNAWLETEAQFAARSSASAKDWEQFREDTDIYPNLKFKTWEDNDVRDDHEKLANTVRPLQDPFWNTHTPPLGWRCRCWLEQTDEPTSINTPNVEVPSEFANNPGVTGEVFKESHSYFQGISKRDSNAVYENTELMKLHIPYSRSIEVGDKKVLINDFADTKDLQGNINAAKMISNKLRKNVYIRPHVHVDGYKNPELGIGTRNKKGDLKTFKNIRDGVEVSLSSHIENRSKSASKQGCEYVVFDMSDCPDEKFNKEFYDKIHGTITPKRNRNIKNIMVLRKNKIAKLTRKQVYNRKFEDFQKDIGI